MMISESPAGILVQAVYGFKGKNNDELNFKKGDIITITQKLEEGGWWEGTLSGKTGWFPANYVKDVAIQDIKPSQNSLSNVLLAVETVPEQQTVNRNLILKDIIDSEKSHITEIQNLIKTILTPLGNADLLTSEEYLQTVRNLPEILDLHSCFVKLLEECYEKPSLEQRVGNIFLSMAEKMKSIHSEYCSSHAKAVCILESYKEKLGALVETLGGKSPGLVFLTAGLSRPFRRLERYAGCLQELERHMEEFHPDRGDTQRSVFIFQNLATHCATVRRQKEQELEVLCGSVRCWEGEEPGLLGELLYMGAVKIASTNSETRDRHLVLFSQCIILLSVSQRLSAFVFEKKILLTGLALNIQEDSDLSRLAFELVVGGSERLVISCPSREERQRLVELLQKQIRSPIMSSPSANSTVLPYTLAHTVPPPSTPLQLMNQQQKPEITRSPAKLNSRGSTPVISRPPVHHTLSGPSGQQYPLNQPFSVHSPPPNSISNRVWAHSCLRPSPPITTRPGLAERSSKSTKVFFGISRKRELTYEDDSQLLQLVEAYCSLTSRSRQTVKSALLESPQVLIAEEEKIIIEEIQGTQIVVEEKSLVDTVYALRDQVRELQNQVTSLVKEVELLKTK